MMTDRKGSIMLFPRRVRGETSGHLSLRTEAVDGILVTRRRAPWTALPSHLSMAPRDLWTATMDGARGSPREFLEIMWACATMTARLRMGRRPVRVIPAREMLPRETWSSWCTPDGAEASWSTVVAVFQLIEPAHSNLHRCLWSIRTHRPTSDGDAHEVEIEGRRGQPSGPDGIAQRCAVTRWTGWIEGNRDERAPCRVGGGIARTNGFPFVLKVHPWCWMARCREVSETCCLEDETFFMVRKTAFTEGSFITCYRTERVEPKHDAA